MNQYTISQDIFWMEKVNGVQIVKGTDPRLYNLEGIAALVFLAIAKQQDIVHPDRELVQRVITDLISLNILQNI